MDKPSHDILSHYDCMWFSVFCFVCIMCVYDFDNTTYYIPYVFQCCLYCFSYFYTHYMFYDDCLTYQTQNQLQYVYHRYDNNIYKHNILTMYHPIYAGLRVAICLFVPTFDTHLTPVLCLFIYSKHFVNHIIIIVIFTSITLYVFWFLFINILFAMLPTPHHTRKHTISISIHCFLTHPYFSFFDI